MKEMHNDLILYEKQVKQINSGNNNLMIQRKLLTQIQSIWIKFRFRINNYSQLFIIEYLQIFDQLILFFISISKIKIYPNWLQQNQIIIERNAQQENEMKKMREQIMHQDNRIRYLENEIHNQSFQQKLTTARPIQSQEKGFPNQYPSSQQNTLQGSFNNQFNQYK